MATNILVIIDPEEATHSALNRVREISPDADVQYKVDLYIDAVPAMAGEVNSDAIKKVLLDKRTWLDGLVSPLKEAGYAISTEVIAFNRLYEEIIKSAKRYGADFVFKPVRQHGTFRRLFYTSTDWNLVRLCDVPLLLVSDEEKVHGRPVIAAIDVGDKDEAHKALNVAVLDQANLLARVIGSKVHIVYAYGPAVIASRSVADPLAVEIERAKYESEHAAVTSVAKQHGIEADNVHMREGATRQVVTSHAEELKAGIVVLGTVARSGASGLFIGNTAESVLESASCDVFVVKPPSFESPERN